MTVKNVPLFMGVLLAVGFWVEADANALSEQDFLGDMPIVLSVSRLAQRLDETPGAVTVIDRDFIRMSGARDVADLLRLVPGFQSTTSFENDAPMASYHGRPDDFSNRLQVLVDGRSVYSGFLFGSTGIGLQTLALDDIERIEVLRGSNSAAYGARAFLGVVNIVSRSVSETAGTMVKLATGQNGVADAGIRLGWGANPLAMFRLSADTRGDSGLRDANGKNRVARVNLSSHFEWDAGNALDVRIGGLDIRSGRGDLDPLAYGAAARTANLGSRHVQLDWERSLHVDQDLRLCVSHSESNVRDNFPFLDPSSSFAPYYGILIDYSGQESRDLITGQLTRRWSPSLRSVAGLEVLAENVVSPSQFDARKEVATQFYRAFGNVEWRLAPEWLANVGVMLEHSPQAGDTASPRAMLNWQMAKGHTLRFGASTAFRPPSAYEKYALVRYFDINGQNPTPAYVQASGNVTRERVVASEVGYHLDLPQPQVSGDLRVFHERVSDGVACSDLPRDCFNLDQFVVRGAEYQLTWRPSRQTRLFLNQSWTNVDLAAFAVADAAFAERHAFRAVHAAPALAVSAGVMHSWGAGWSFSVLRNQADGAAISSVRLPQDLKYLLRTDARLAKVFRWTGSKVEASLTLQGADGSFQDGASNRYFDRRVFFGLQIGD